MYHSTTIRLPVDESLGFELGQRGSNSSSATREPGRELDLDETFPRREHAGENVASQTVGNGGSRCHMGLHRRVPALLFPAAGGRIDMWASFGAEFLRGFEEDCIGSIIYVTRVVVDNIVDRIGDNHRPHTDARRTLKADAEINEVSEFVEGAGDILPTAPTISDLRSRSVLAAGSPGAVHRQGPGSDQRDGDSPQRTIRVAGER